MARVIHDSTRLTVQASSAGTITPAGGLPAHQTGDLLLCLICHQATAGSAIAETASSGWTVATKVANTSHTTTFAWKIAASASETAPVFSNLSTTNSSLLVLVIRDADATTPIGSDFASVANATGALEWSSPALTPSNADSLLIYWAGLNGPAYCRYSQEKLEPLIPETDQLAGATDASAAQICAYAMTQHGAAAPVADYKFFTQTSVTRNTTWVLAIKNASGGKSNAQLTSNIKEIHWGMNIFNAPVGTPTVQAPNNFAASINGISLSGSAAATAAFGVSDVYSNGWTALSSTDASGFGGINLALASAIDMSGKTFSLEWMCANSANAVFIGAEGAVIGFSDGTNWVAYRLKPAGAIASGAWVAGAAYRTFLDLGTTTPYDSSGSINWAAVTDIVLLINKSTSGAATLRIRNVFLHNDKMLLRGGASDEPLNYIAAHRTLSQPTTIGLVQKQGASQFLMTHDFDIGDGSAVTVWDSSVQALELPLGDGLAFPYRQIDWRVAANAVSLGLNASAADSIALASGLAGTTLQQGLVFNAASSGAATYDFTGQVFVNYLPTLATNVPVANCTFKQCGTVQIKAGTLTNVQVIDTTSTNAAVASDTTGGTLDSVTIEANGADYHLELGVDCESITLTDVTFTGTAGVDKVHVLKTTGTVTINISGTTTLVAGDVTTEGATVNIVSDPVYQSVVVSGFTAGTRIQIYDDTNDTELFNGTASSGDTVVSGSVAMWTDPVAAAGNRAIRVRVSYVNGASAEIFQELSGLTCGPSAGNANVTYPVTPEADAVYNANGIDGPAIYATSGITFTDAATDLVNCDIAGGTVSWATIYACFVHWMNTAAGIADDIAYIQAVDPANYLTTAMKIRNISATPLTITGGWGRDSTTLTIADVIDSAGSTGNIYPLPDHVVNNIVTVGGVNIITGDINDVPGKVQSGMTAQGFTAALAAIIEESRKLLRNKRVIDPATGIETVYDDDGSPLLTRQVYTDAAGATPYDGTEAPHRVERYT